jgi:hypothetical protein
MASLSSHNNCIPLSTLLEWYRIRDTFFGQNQVEQNIALALEMAASCAHSDSKWLTVACAEKGVKTSEDAKNVFLSLGPNDVRALCFAWMCGDKEEKEDRALLRRSAERGFAFAQYLMAVELQGGEESFKFARLAAAQGERDGFYLLGGCFKSGDGCENDIEKAKENYLLASNLGHVSAMVDLGDLFEELLDGSDPQQWRWWGRAAKKGKPDYFLVLFAKQVELFNSGSGSAVVMFAIGQALHGHVNVLEGTIFNMDWKFESLIHPAQQAIWFFELQLKASRLAVDEWTKVGIRLKVVKDVRKLIAKLIWDAREEALYDISAVGKKEPKREQRRSARKSTKRARK